MVYEYTVEGVALSGAPVGALLAAEVPGVAGKRPLHKIIPGSPSLPVLTGLLLATRACAQVGLLLPRGSGFASHPRAIFRLIVFCSLPSRTCLRQILVFLSARATGACH